ncbi:MAG: M48 family metalloprotease [Pirellulaceae bacterium]
MTVGFAVLYFLPTLAKFFFPSGTPLAANPTDPEQQALLHALSQVCQKTGTTIPRVYLRSDGSPNISSYGVYGRWAVLYVNRGLLQTIQDPDELQAPVAHEISHIRRFDTLLSCCLVPVLWIVKGVLACVHTVAFSTRKGMRHMRLSPAMLMMLMLGGRGMGLVGCLIGLFIVIAFAFMAVFFLTYAVMALGVLLAFAIACRLYSQHMEKAADIDAVQIVGDPDRVLVALAQSGDYWPAEKATVDQYVAQHLGNVANYTLNDVIRTVKSGGDPCSGVDWRERLFRSHPLLVERIANVVGIFGSKLA